MDKQHQKWLQKEIDKFKDDGVIEEIPLVERQAGKYFHFMPVHTVPKKNGERRFILDARSPIAIAGSPQDKG